MSQEQHGLALATPPAAVWPPDDTEESVLGTNLHQATITNLRLGLNEVASLLIAQGTMAFSQALSQTAISGLQRWDGSSYTVLPDVFVYRQEIDEQRATLHLAEDGPPLLIVEVLSPKTQLQDLDLERGKGFSYARAGVQEYLILDPGGAELAEKGRGWRLEHGVYVPWQPDGAGRWQSQVIPVAVGFEGTHLVVFDRHGRRQLREREVARTVAQMEGKLARQAEAIAEKAAEVARMDEEIAALRRLLDQRRGE